MDTRRHILIVEDERDIRSMVAAHLTRDGFRVTAAADGRAIEASLAHDPPDLIVLDVMLRREHGFDLCRTLRHRSDVPVVMLTALGDEDDRVAGLDCGADDYIAKPFDPRELSARIKAVLARVGRGVEPGRQPVRGIVRFAGWTFDTAGGELRRPDGATVPLTSGEIALLRVFVAYPQTVLQRERLHDLIKGAPPAGPQDRAIDTQVSRLRRKVEPDPAEPQLIKTVWGGGYTLAAPVEPA